MFCLAGIEFGVVDIVVAGGLGKTLGKMPAENAATMPLTIRSQKGLAAMPRLPIRKDNTVDK